MQQAMAANRIQDHLFISYATEQAALADWLALKLTAAGYLVWWDRGRLLGGESYPHDIDRAIKEQTFRVIAILSSAALEKPNPTGERTLALKIGAERKIDFLIPVNATGLSGSELDWMTTNLTFIPFHRSWAVGFRQLIAKLESVDAPRQSGDGHKRVADWYNRRSDVESGHETLWVNALAIEGVPAEIYRLDAETGWLDQPPNWISHWPDRSTGWCLHLPESELPVGVTATPVRWGIASTQESKVLDIVVTLLRKHFEASLVARGMRVDAEIACFPSGLLNDERLRYTSTAGRQNSIKATGQRNFRTLDGGRTSVNYYLGFASHPDFRTFGRWMLLLHPRIILRDLSDQLLEPRLANRRRKAMCRLWFNHQWGTRFKAIAEWLAPLDQPTPLSQHPDEALSLMGTAVKIAAPFTLEEKVGEPPLEDERIDVDERDGLGHFNAEQDA
jgi:hypothetical protein